MIDLSEKILEMTRHQERYLLNLRERIERVNKNIATDSSYLYNVAVMKGYLDCLDLAGVDRSEFNWIFL